MTRSTEKKGAECHVLDFFYDDEDGCALTVFTNGVRFHIIADPERLRDDSPAGKDIAHKYKSLISALRDEIEDNDDDEEVKKRKELDAAELHDPDLQGLDSQDSGHPVEEEVDGTAKDETSDHDSAVDLSEGKSGLKEIDVRDSGVVLGERCASEAEKSLHRWMLSPFPHVFNEKAPASQRPENPTLHDWYHGPAYSFNLEVKDGELSTSLDTSQELEKRINDLVPSMPLPKYLKDLQITMVQAKDMIVVEEGTEPEPYHPTRVKVGDEVQFLKIVDMTQYQPTKREIRLLKEIEKKGLHEKFKVPRVLGLAYDESKSKIMGFLQTDIEDPTPLTKMLNSDVVEDNRNRWADESERIVKLLHENGIIWGDAKADNFVVDRHNELWIIDFGGSYTDGWVDPELTETKEGDEMGTEKIVNALRDPESNTFDPGQESDGAHEEEDGSAHAGDADDVGQKQPRSQQSSTSNQKRGRDNDSDTDNDADTDGPSSKRRK